MEFQHPTVNENIAKTPTLMEERNRDIISGMGNSTSDELTRKEGRVA